MGEGWGGCKVLLNLFLYVYIGSDNLVVLLDMLNIPACNFTHNVFVTTIQSALLPLLYTYLPLRPLDS